MTSRVLGALAVVLLVAVPVLALTALGPGLFALEAPSVASSAPEPAAGPAAGPAAEGAAVLDGWRFTQNSISALPPRPR